MKPKMVLKLVVDMIMTILLFLLMAYLLVGETVHEWMGLAMFILFIFHHALNWKWYRNLFRGKYTPLRIWQTVLNILLLAAMIALMVSGIILSREVFDFLDISGGMGIARTIHMLASYWGFLFMSMHLGLHWSMVMGMIRRAAGIRNPSGDPDMGTAYSGSYALRIWDLCLQKKWYCLLYVPAVTFCIFLICPSLWLPFSLNTLE